MVVDNRLRWHSYIESIKTESSEILRIAEVNSGARAYYFCVASWDMGKTVRGYGVEEVCKAFVKSNSRFDTS
jgi:hypothetical protein